MGMGLLLSCLISPCITPHLQDVIKPATLPFQQRYADVPSLIPPEDVGPPTLFVRSVCPAKPQCCAHGGQSAIACQLRVGWPVGVGWLNRLIR
jgi:hypothetical protein